MADSCACPAEIVAVPSQTCPNKYPNITALAQQRNGYQFLDAVNPIQDEASWTAFITAVDDSKIAGFKCDGFNVAEGDPTRDGDATNTATGVGLSAGQASPIWDTSITEADPEVYEAISANFECNLNTGILPLGKTSVMAEEVKDALGAVIGYQVIPIADNSQILLTPPVGNRTITRSKLEGVFENERWNFTVKAVQLDFNTKNLFV